VNDEDGAREQEKERGMGKEEQAGAEREGTRSRGIKHARADVERSAPLPPLPRKSEKDERRFSEGLADLGRLEVSARRR